MFGELFDSGGMSAARVRQVAALLGTLQQTLNLVAQQLGESCDKMDTSNQRLAEIPAKLVQHELNSSENIAVVARATSDARAAQ